MLKLSDRPKGFTIVELLIVIVVIAILATISVVAYNGVQGRARDSKRKSDLASIVKLLELYQADNGGYPICNSVNPYQGGALSASTLTYCLTPALVPKYTNSIPRDPVNVAPETYYYGVGYRKTGTNTYTGDATNNYIIGARMDGGGLTVNGWGVTLNYLLGSSN
jgi:general secretion pathway protein G